MKELSITEARGLKLFQALDSVGGTLSRKQRISMLTQLVKDLGIHDNRRDQTWKFSVGEIASVFVDAYADFALLKQFLVPSYARDTRIDTYGKVDERKFHASVLRILKREGLVENSSYGVYDHIKLELVTLFCRLTVQSLEQHASSAYARGLDYETRVANALESVARNVSRTPNGADFGADITFSYAGREFVAQCKAHNRAVGVSAVQEVSAAISHYAAEFGIVFSESGFSDQALRLADSNGILMVEGVNIESFERQVSLLRLV